MLLRLFARFVPAVALGASVLVGAVGAKAACPQYTFLPQQGYVSAAELDANFSCLASLPGNVNGILQGNGSGSVSAVTIGSGLTYSGGVLSAAVSSNPLVIGFVLNTGATGTGVGPILIAPYAGSVTKVKVVTKASDGGTALTFRIKQNGTDIFTSDPTVAAGTAGGTVSTFTALTSSPLSVSANDLFTLDVTSGTSSWQVTIQLEP